MVPESPSGGANVAGEAGGPVPGPGLPLVAAAAPGEGWVVHAKCADLPRSTFFPSDVIGAEVAKRICAGCAVRRQCLAYALANRIEHGVWGGATERERRRKLRRGRA